jgi:hypothetical protein
MARLNDARDHGTPHSAHLLQERLKLALDLLKARFGPIDRIQLVHRNHELSHAQRPDQQRVLARLAARLEPRLKLIGRCVDNEDGHVSLQGDTFFSIKRFRLVGIAKRLASAAKPNFHGDQQPSLMAMAALYPDNAPEQRP